MYDICHVVYRYILHKGKREYGKTNLYYNSEVCVCVSVCLCRFYLKTVNGNDLILFATWRHSSSSGFKILTKFL